MSSRIVISALTMDKALSKAMDRVVYEDDLRAKAKKKAKSLPKPKAVRPSKMSDEQILECRALHEYERVPTKVLAEKYGVSKGYLVGIIYYVRRPELVPAKP